MALLDGQKKDFADKLYANPALGVLIALIPGILFAEKYPYPFIRMFLLAISSLSIFYLLLSLYLHRKKGYPGVWTPCIVALLSFTLGFVINSYEKNKIRLSDLTTPSFEARAIITETPQFTKKALRLPIRVITKESLHPQTIMLYHYGEDRYKYSTLRIGDTIACAIRKITPLSEISLPSYRRWLRSKNISATAIIGTSPDHPPISTFYRTTPPSLKAYAADIREQLVGYIYSLPIERDDQALIATVSLGYRNEETVHINHSFRDIGVAHLLAVSGFHLAIVIAFAAMLLKIFDYFPRLLWVKPLLLILIAWIFSFVTGLATPTLRAALMVTIYYLGFILIKPKSVLNTLATSAFIILFFHPGALFELGFQLSYLAVLSIILFQPIFAPSRSRQHNRLLLYFYNTIVLCLSAQILTFPILLYNFGTFPLIFLWSNIVVASSVSILIPSFFVLLILSPLLSSTPIYLFLIKVVSLLSHFSRSSATFFEDHGSWAKINYNINLQQSIGLYFIIIGAYYLLYILRCYISKKIQRESSL